ncbi:TlpA family protein disulfide reductase [Marinifilum sp. D737]|uniref:TlpA family protein disulfide reductase n=1 Tax=Marinifilum sp. D737 TaxID=2969628 RepID=UPI00227BF5A9|nr:TlpA disulfide reductase family protein [Marinifilum sp. D737]
MVRTIILSLLLLVTIHVNAQKAVIISGSMKAYKYDLYLKGQTTQDKLTEAKTLVELNEDGSFEITINLKEPKMLNLGFVNFQARPGDNVRIVESNENNRSKFTFEGDNAEVNNFVNDHALYTKSGSWCQMGMNVRKYKTIEEFIEFCKNEKTKYLNELKALKAPKAFKKEYARKLELHYYYSLTIYPQYYSIFNKGTDVSPFYEVVKKQIPRKIKIKSVDSEVDRAILSSNVLKHIEVEIETTKQVEIYQEVSALLSELQSAGISGELVKRKDEVLAKVSNKLYKQVISKAFAKYDKVLPGALVDNLKFVNTENEEIELAQYKGKIVVIDVWATWCGPCMQEKPHFAELAKKYKDNKGVVFLAVSVDDSKAWEKYCSKHHDTENVEFVNIERAKMDAAFLTKFVPRFIVIGKNQKIIDAFAPKPSSGKLDQQVEKGLKYSN